MIIIDIHTENHLTAMLETWRTNPERWRILYLKRSAVMSLQHIPATDICAYFAAQVDDTEANAFIAADGDIFIVTNHLKYEAFQKFVLSMSALYKADTTSHSRLFDMQCDWQELKTIIHAKADAIALAKKEAEEVRRLEMAACREQEHARNRQDIMAMDFNPDMVGSLNTRRRARPHAEILIVEDDRFAKQLVQSALGKYLNVNAAENGREALIQYVLNPPDIVFLDINLPDIHGFDVLKKLLSVDPEAFIVMLSGNGARENIMRALSQGAKGFVGKPFTPKKLMEYIHKSPWMRPHSEILMQHV